MAIAAVFAVVVGGATFFAGGHDLHELGQLGPWLRGMGVATLDGVRERVTVVFDATPATSFDLGRAVVETRPVAVVVLDVAPAVGPPGAASSSSPANGARPQVDVRARALRGPTAVEGPLPGQPDEPLEPEREPAPGSVAPDGGGAPTPDDGAGGAGPGAEGPGRGSDEPGADGVEAPGRGDSADRGGDSPGRGSGPEGDDGRGRGAENRGAERGGAADESPSGGAADEPRAEGATNEPRGDGNGGGHAGGRGGGT